MANLYPRPQGLNPDRRAALRSVVVSDLSEGSTAKRLRRPRFAAVPITIGLVVLLAALATLRPWVAPTRAWAAVPESPDAATTARLAEDCASAIAARHFPLAIATYSTALAEIRGSSRAVLLGSNSQVQICIASRDAEFDSMGVYDVSGGAGSAGTVDAVLGDGHLRVIFGRVTSSTDKVTVATADGLSVTASVATTGGTAYYLAWWPSAANATAVVVTNEGATHRLTVPDQTSPTPLQR
jgi:hypothetical protein